MVYECGDLLAESRAVPRRAAAHGRRRRPRPDPPGAAASGHLRRQPAYPRRAASTAFRTESSSSSTPPDRRHRAAAQGRPVPVRARRRRSGSRWTATRPTTSRSPASSSGCTAIGQPKVVIGVSGGLDSTHALIVAAKAMDRLGRPRSDILAFTMPGFATGETTKSLRHPAGQGARRDLRGDRHPPGRRADAHGPRPPVRRRRGGLRRHLRERPGRAALPTTCSGSPTSAAASCVGTGDLSELALGWCTYGVGDQMSHYNVNAGVPKTLIQHLIRWVVDSGQFDAETQRRCCERDPRARRSPPS